MSSANGGNAHALMRDDEHRARELADGVQGTSPTPRSAAYHSDVELAGRSQAFVEMMKQVDLVSGTDSPVLLTGEPGAGQEFVAAAIHQHSDRNDRPFVMINCATIPAELIEAKLLEADGGTVFLDEVTQTSASLQLNLSRLVQTGELRVIAASSCDLEQDVAAGRFSHDLFSALSAVTIALPPLLDHHENISAETAGHADDDLVTLSEAETRTFRTVRVPGRRSAGHRRADEVTHAVRHEVEKALRRRT